ARKVRTQHDPVRSLVDVHGRAPGPRRHDLFLLAARARERFLEHAVHALLQTHEVAEGVELFRGHGSRLSFQDTSAIAGARRKTRTESSKSISIRSPGAYSPARSFIASVS